MRGKHGNFAMVGAFQEPQDGYISCLHGAVDSRAAASIQHFSIGPALQQIARPLHVLVAHGDMQWRPGRQTGQTQHARMTEEREGRPNVYTCGWVVRHTCLHKTPTHNPHGMRFFYRLFASTALTSALCSSRSRRTAFKSPSAAA